MTEDVELDYDFLMQNALRGLMRDVLTMVAELGDAPGEHHFYIEFLTQAPDVTIPDHLISEYPERMTIVLQHQFEGLIVRDDSFAVSLWFKGKEAKLDIPFDAVVSFADPSVQFGLRFEPDEAGSDHADADNAGEEQPDASAADETKPAADDDDKASDGADIVSLDSFRKK